MRPTIERPPLSVYINGIKGIFTPHPNTMLIPLIGKSKIVKLYHLFSFIIPTNTYTLNISTFTS